MLDVNDFIVERGGDPEKIRESQRRRNASVEAVDEVIAMWQDFHKSHYAANTSMGAGINAVQKQIGLRKKAKENADDLLAKKKELEAEKKVKEEETAQKKILLDRKIKSIGNYVHNTVPISNNEDSNELVRDWVGENLKPEKKQCLSHHDVLSRLEGYDPERGVKIAGHRGYCLTGYGVFLNLALIQYGLEFLHARGYTPNQPPFFMNRDAMAKTAQLEQFDEELYHVATGVAGEDKYLIATSEQPLSCLHEAEWLQDKDLPIRYAGYSTCFRKEAGSHGRDAWGIFRVHQFEKIEQFVFCNPEKSWEEFDRMISISEEFYKTLELPYRVVAIVSGALNNAAAKKYDLEAWFPFQGEYKELVSCSNCTDYQTRELEIRFGPKTQTDKDARKKNYVYALNSTLCATERALCCIIENWQTDKGVVVPPVLRKYIPGQPDFLPFTANLSTSSTSAKAGIKAEKVEPVVKDEAKGGKGVVETVVDGVKNLTT